MTHDLSWLNTDDVDASAGSGGGWKVKPNGWYRAMVTESEVRPSSSGTGTHVRIKLSHLDQRYSNQYEMVFLNVQHSKPRVQEIGQAQFKALAIAVGDPTPGQVKSSKDIENKPLMIQLYSKQEPGKYADVDGNVQCVGGYKSCDDYDTEHGGPPASNSAPPPDDNPPPLSDNDLPF